MHRQLLSLLGTLLLLSPGFSAELSVTPSRVRLDRPEASQQVLVTGVDRSGRPVDVTRIAGFRVLDPKIAGVDRMGRIVPRADGRTRLEVEVQGRRLNVEILVEGQLNPPPVSFQHEIIPILTKARCNSAACHGKAEGQNGFKLSVFGYDPGADHEALVSESRQRRVVLTAPASSLLIRKSSSETPHGGGRMIAPGSLPYRRLNRWVAEGARFVAGGVRVTGVVIEPASRTLYKQESQQIQVTAIDAAGRRYCVTSEAEFSSNAELVAHVDESGWVQAGEVAGEAVILVRYMGHVAVCRVTRPRPDVRFARPDVHNFIDALAWDKLAQLGLPPSDKAGDAMFLRRVFLDTIGTLPSAAEARRFLADQQPDRRNRLVERLLERDEYADFQALRWSDILRVDRDRVTPEGAVAMTRWLKRQFAENRPYDAFAREILVARGDTLEEGPAALYRVLEKPEALSRAISQLFLGVRIECAQCHHHPFEKWTQADYFAFAGFFTGLKRKSLPTGNPALLVTAGSDLKHARSGELIPTRALGAAAPADFSRVSDRREVLADWMTSPGNPFFARAIANRLWAHYFGRGLVEPIDDLRETNPSVNEPLLAALAKHMVELKFDLKAFTRTLLGSRLYQLSSVAVAQNSDDLQNFSHAIPKALQAEVLLDAICQVTGIPEKFNGWPRGYRAIQIWDNRMPSYFFRIFGRPVRASVCECERSNEPSISQALHLINSPEIQAKLTAENGTARRWAASKLKPDEIIDEMFLSTVSRFPRPKERALFREVFTTTERREAVADCLWTLLNSKQFLYNH